MTGDPPDKERDALRRVLVDLDSDTAAGLRELAENNPDLLQETLDDLGYLPATNEGLVENRETTELSDAQQRIADALQEMGSPRSTDEIIELLQKEHENIIQEFQSAKHRPWMSKQLNELVSEGLLGRFRDGRTVRYTTEPTEAVRHWALHNNRFVEDLDRGDARTIAEDTDMPVRIARQALDRLATE